MGGHDQTVDSPHSSFGDAGPAEFRPVLELVQRSVAAGSRRMAPDFAAFRQTTGGTGWFPDLVSVLRRPGPDQFSASGSRGADFALSLGAHPLLLRAVVRFGRPHTVDLAVGSARSRRGLCVSFRAGTRPFGRQPRRSPAASLDRLAHRNFRVRFRPRPDAPTVGPGRYRHFTRPAFSRYARCGCPDGWSSQCDLQRHRPDPRSSCSTPRPRDGDREKGTVSDPHQPTRYRSSSPMSGFSRPHVDAER